MDTSNNENVSNDVVIVPASKILLKACLLDANVKGLFKLNVC